MFADENRIEAVHGLCCDAMKADAIEIAREQEEPAEVEHPSYWLPCD